MLKKVSLSLLLITMVVTAGVSVVSNWEQTTTYEGQEIVRFNDVYYIAQWWVKGSEPTTGESWKEIPFLLTPSVYKPDSMYDAGSAISFEGRKFVARHIADGNEPNRDDPWGAWVMADMSNVNSGPIAKLPLDPGIIAGKKTILGIDSDGDGVRDDMQREITFMFPNDVLKRASAMFLAKSSREVIEKFLATPNCTYEDLKSTYFKVDAAIYGAGNNIHYDWFSTDEFSAMENNTVNRLLTSSKIDRVFNGNILSSFDEFPDIEKICKDEFNLIYKLEEERQK